MDILVAKAFAASIALLSFFGVALALGNLFSSYMQSVARNPSAQPKLQAMTFIGMALIEALGIFAFTVAMIIIFVL